MVSLSLLDWWGPDVAEMPLITCGLFGASSHKMMMWISMVFCFIIIIINYSLTCKEIASKAAKWLKRKTAYRKRKKNVRNYIPCLGFLRPLIANGFTRRYNGKRPLTFLLFIYLKITFFLVKVCFILLFFSNTYRLATNKVKVDNNLYLSNETFTKKEVNYFFKI